MIRIYQGANFRSDKGSKGLISDRQLWVEHSLGQVSIASYMGTRT